jgi:hypothetical protein
MRELWEGDTTMNCLLVNVKPRRRRWLDLDAAVVDFAEKTGGEVVYFRNAAQPFTEMLDRIRRRYTVFYRPLEGDKKKRKVLVGLSETGRARHAEATVVGRREYSVP